MSTEFGYETNPPDPFNGIPQDQQAEWINLGDYLMWADPRIVGNTQFLFRDGPPNNHFPPSSRKHWFPYQTGIYNADDTPKPSAQAYAMPLVLSPIGQNPDGTTQLGVWGQLRFRPNGVPGDTVQLQFRAQGSDAWADQGAPIAVNDPLGYYQGSVTAPFPAVWRAVWSNPGQYPFALSSREVVVSS
jgi:hypothetical protein